MADGLNRYLYARGSPIRLMDGSGLEGEDSAGMCYANGLTPELDSVSDIHKNDIARWEAQIAAEANSTSEGPQMFGSGSDALFAYINEVSKAIQEEYLEAQALISTYFSSAGGLAGTLGKYAGDGVSAVQNAGTGSSEQSLEQRQVTAALSAGLGLIDIGAVGKKLSPNKKVETSKTPEAKPVPDVSAFVGVGAAGKGGNASKGVDLGLRAPARRHRLTGVSQKTVTKKVNTVVEPGVDMAGDVAAINRGAAVRVGDTFEINGRVYGSHDGTLYPIAGEGFHQLNRGAFKALGVLNKFGNTPQAHEILGRMYNVGASEIDAATTAWRAGQ